MFLRMLLCFDDQRLITATTSLPLVMHLVYHNLATLVMYLAVALQLTWALVFVVFLTYRILLALDVIDADTCLLECLGYFTSPQDPTLKPGPKLGSHCPPRGATDCTKLLAYFDGTNSRAMDPNLSYLGPDFVKNDPCYPKTSGNCSNLSLEFCSGKKVPRNVSPKADLQERDNSPCSPVNNTPALAQAPEDELKPLNSPQSPSHEISFKYVEIAKGNLDTEDVKCPEVPKVPQVEVQTARLLDISNVAAKKRRSKQRAQRSSNPGVSLVGALSFNKAVERPKKTTPFDVNFPSLESARSMRKSKKGRNQTESTITEKSEERESHLKTELQNIPVSESPSPESNLSPHFTPTQSPHLTPTLSPHLTPTLSPHLTPTLSPHLTPIQSPKPYFPLPQQFRLPSPPLPLSQAPIYPNYSQYLPQTMQPAFCIPRVIHRPINYHQVPNFTPNIQFNKKPNLPLHYPAQGRNLEYLPQQPNPAFSMMQQPLFPMQTPPQYNPYLPQQLPWLPQHMPITPQLPQTIPLNPIPDPAMPLSQYFPQNTLTPTLEHQTSQFKFSTVTFYPRNEEVFEANHPEHYVHSRECRLNPNKLDLLADMGAFISPQNQSYYDFASSDFATRPISHKDPIFGATYERILSDFSNTPEFEDRVRVLDIECVENAFLFLTYELKRLELEQLFLQVTEYHLFHGVTTSAIDHIGSDNFRPRRYVTKYGKGVPFSKRPFLSSKHTAGVVRKMLVARVLISEVNVGDEGSQLPMSGCDTTRSPDFSVFVKYDDHAFYPQYVVSFLLSQQHDSE